MVRVDKKSCEVKTQILSTRVRDGKSLTSYKHEKGKGVTNDFYPINSTSWMK